MLHLGCCSSTRPASDMEKVQHRNGRGGTRTPGTSKIKSFATIFNGFVYLRCLCGLGRSSRPEVFLRKGVLKICCKFTGEHPCQSAVSWFD